MRKLIIIFAIGFILGSLSIKPTIAQNIIRIAGTITGTSTTIPISVTSGNLNVISH